MKKCLIAVCLVFLPVNIFAFDRIFEDSCAKAGIPKSLAIAIARQESNLHPWCINIQGKDYVPTTYDQACEIIRKAHKAGKSYDVGIMQINCEWTKRWKINPLDLLDPHTNIKIGLEILKQEIKRHGLNWVAVGKYHSPRIDRGRRYAWKVYNRMGGGSIDKAKIAKGETQKRHIERAPYRDGIFRSNGVERKGRLISFGIRKEGLSGEPGAKPGGSTGKTGIIKN